MIPDLSATLSGFGVGVIVGMTGIGGGALMTPVLLLVFGIAPQTAVGTDLLFACVTKVFGVIVHGRRGTVDWQIVRRLAAGSLPAAALSLLMLGYFKNTHVRDGLIVHALAAVLLLTAGGLILRGRLREVGRTLRTQTPVKFKHAQPGLTILAGVIVGCLVTLTSVGAGALGTAMLVYLYPYRLNAGKLVGTDLAHAIPLTLVAGAGHLLMGNINFSFLANLLIGSVPGILLGATLSTRAPDGVTRFAIAAILTVVAVRLLL
jgi:uncharacterized membrane protein YfcA